jgi:putative acetyltransferase
VTTIRSETPADYRAIAAVIRAAFGRVDEARLVGHLRDGQYARVSLVAEEDRALVGHVLFSELAIVTEPETVWALSLAPLSVAPKYQRRGIGTALVTEGLRICRDSGHEIVIVLGDPAFYARLGFRAQLAEPLRSPFAGPHLMALELVKGALDLIDGELHYPPPFRVFEGR